MRYLLEICYDGTDFHGFQKQNNAHTVEEALESALKTYLREDVDIVGSSRTDKGVNARANSAHFDLDRQLNSKDLYRINSILGLDLAINAIHQVDADFHARFDADARSYSYFIHDFKSPLVRHQSYYYPYTLDFEKLQATSALLVGERDFSSFSKKNTDVHHYRCDIEYARWIKSGHELRFEVKANRFLRGMVRALVASQLAVARDYWTMNQFGVLLEQPQISSALFSAPAHGLFLDMVYYDTSKIRPLPA